MDQFALPTALTDAVSLRPGERTLQRVLVDRATEVRPLYWRASRHESAGSGPYDSELRADGTICLLPGTILSFDTYFGAFFESHWRMNTRLQDLVLSVSVAGPCIVRLRRRSIGVDRLLGEQRVDGSSPSETLRFPIPDQSGNFREYGLLYFEVAAAGAGARFLDASWLGAAPTDQVRLGVVFCTFNRESFMAAVLQTLVGDPVLLAGLDRVFVVNQGTPGLASHPLIAPQAARLGARLTIIDQGNFGGAGGFTRGMLATLDDPSLTHCAFLDDDIRLEPDTILRLIAFLSLANENVAVGGHMLDSVQPTRLYEGGAIIGTSDWFPRPVQHDVDLTSPEGLNRLAQPQPVHFNGWWCFAVSLDIVRRMGLPMPCFIRGDDAEYGMRLYRSGIRTIPLPGAAVWHEPFYLKLGNWQLYYETRNLLVLASLHGRFNAASALRRAGRSWLMHLLTFRYYGAMLILHGVTDFLAGPDVLRNDPQTIHASITGMRKRYGPQTFGRRHVLDPARLPRMPKRRIVFLFWFVVVLLRNALRPTGRREPLIVGQGEFSWIGLRRLDHFVLDNWWEPEMSAYRRDRGTFWQLTRRTLPVMARLFRHGNRIADAWKLAAPDLTSTGFWRSYLGCPSETDVPSTSQPLAAHGVEAGSAGGVKRHGTDEAHAADETNGAHEAHVGRQAMVAGGAGAALE